MFSSPFIDLTSRKLPRRNPNPRAVLLSFCQIPLHLSSTFIHIYIYIYLVIMKADETLVFAIKPVVKLFVKIREKMGPHKSDRDI